MKDFGEPEFPRQTFWHGVFHAKLFATTPKSLYCCFIGQKIINNDGLTSSCEFTA